MMKNDGFISWGIFILLCIIWGSSFILMRWGSEGLSAAQIASVRIFSAGIVVLPFALFQFSKIPGKKIPLVILSAVCGNLLPAYLFAAAIIKNIDSSLAGILNSLTPICVIVIGILFFGAKPGSRKIMGVLIGFGGLCLLTLSGKKGISFENLEFALWIVLATVLYGVNVNLVSRFLKDLNPIHLATVSLASMIIPTALVLWQQDILRIPFDESAVRWSLISSVILGIVATAIATILFYMLVKRAGGLFASLVTYGIPFVAITWGFVYGENITLLQIGCLGIILSGVYLANR
jgi:drug/metabolite transporter (DMT)-like permease